MPIGNIFMIEPDPDRWKPEAPAFKKVIVGPQTWEPGEGWRIRLGALLFRAAALLLCGSALYGAIRWIAGGKP